MTLAVRLAACQLAVAMVGPGPASEERIDDVIQLAAMFEALIARDGASAEDPDISDYPTIGGGG